MPQAILLPPSGEVARSADRGFYAILLVVIARHEVPRQSVGIRVGVYAANFTHGDRHACARDDTENLLSLRGSEATKQSPGRVGFRKAYTISLWSWDIERSEISHRTI